MSSPPSEPEASGAAVVRRHRATRAVRQRPEDGVAGDGGEPEPAGQGDQRTMEQPPHRHPRPRGEDWEEMGRGSGEGRRAEGEGESLNPQVKEISERWNNLLTDIHDREVRTGRRWGGEVGRGGELRERGRA